MYNTYNENNSYNMHTVNCYAHTLQKNSFKTTCKDKNIKLLRKTNDWCRLPDRIQFLEIPA